MGQYPFQNVGKEGTKFPQRVNEALRPIEQFKKKTSSVTGVSMHNPEIQVSIEMTVSMEVWQIESMANPFPTSNEGFQPQASRTNPQIRSRSISRSKPQIRGTSINSRSLETDSTRAVVPCINSTRQRLKQNQLLNLYLHELLIYFRVVAERVEEALENAKRIKHLRELKEGLKEFVDKLGDLQVSQEIDVDNFSNHPRLKEILSCKDKIKTIYKKLALPNLKQLLHKNVGTTFDQMLCSIIGLDEKFAKEYLSNISLEHRNHASYLYWIETYFDSCSEKLDRDKSRQENFMLLGFNDVKADFLSKSLEDFPYANHQTLVSWAKQHVQLLFKYDILLNSDTAHCPFQDHPIGEEFEIETESEGTKIKAINVKKDSPEAISLQNKFRNTKSAQEETSLIDRKLELEEYWFHGTDHKSAYDIITNGIETTEGKAGKDFSNKNGFYLSPHLSYPLWWSSKKIRQAVIIFKPDKDFFKNRKGKEFDGPTQEWTQFVTFNREKEFRQPKGVDKRTIQTYKSWEYAYGRISKDGANFSKENPRSINEMQICLRN